MDQQTLGASALTPSSASTGTIYASPGLSQQLLQALSPIRRDIDVKDEEEDHDEHDRSDRSHSDDTTGEPSRKKQKRNKPTLSCQECVERKTKVRRAREWS